MGKQPLAVLPPVAEAAVAPALSGWARRIVHPPVERLVPVEAADVVDMLYLTYTLAGDVIPFPVIEKEAPLLYRVYKHFAAMDEAAQGRTAMGEAGIDATWRETRRFWPEVERASQHPHPQVRLFAQRFGEAVQAMQDQPCRVL